MYSSAICAAASGVAGNDLVVASDSGRATDRLTTP